MRKILLRVAEAAVLVVCPKYFTYLANEALLTFNVVLYPREVLP